VKFRTGFAVLLLAFSAHSLAGVVDLGPLGVPSLTPIGNSFDTPGSYQDDYLFSISQQASADGMVLELDPWWNTLNINVTQVSLSGVGSFAGPATLGVYNFGALAAGSYTLSIFSSVTGIASASTRVGYWGLLGMKGTASSTPTGVPEPGTTMLFATGLIGVYLSVRRRPAAS
jgi:hypothetical protein